MSPPAVNAPPAPVRRTKRTASSASSSPNTPASWSRASIETRFSLPGTSSVIVATSPSRSTRKPSWLMSVSVVSRSILRMIFPDADFGSSATKRYSRGRLKRARARRRDRSASSSSAVALPTTQATTRWPKRSSGAPTTATSATAGCRASTSSTSSGWMFSPPETIMSSTRPTIQRSPSASMRPSPRAVPAVVERLLVSVRPVPVAREGLVGGEVAEHSPSMPGGSSRRRAFRAGRPAQPGLARWSRRDGEGVDLGRAVVVDEDLRLERRGDALGEGGRHRGAGIGDAAHRRDVVLGERGVGDEVVEERRGEVERRDPLPFDQGERGLGRPLGLGDVAAADQRHGDHRVVAHGVVEGHHAERAVAVAEPVVHDLRGAAGALGAVRARDALRPAGRARRVEHDRVRGLVEVERARMLLARRQVLQRVVLGGDERRAGVLDAVLEVGLRAAPRERHEHRAEPLARPEQQDRLAAVSEHRRQAVAPSDARAGEASGQAGGALAELGVRQALAAVDQRLALGEALGGVEQRERHVHAPATSAMASTIGA